MIKSKLKLTLVTHKLNQPTHHYLDFISECAQSGVTAVQLREKHLENNELLVFGKKIKKLLDQFHIPLFVNDSLDLCLTLNACGLHLGQTDGDVFFARKKLGPKKMIGLTVNTTQQIEIANDLPLDYIGIGAIFSTTNKLNVQTIWGLDGLANASAISKHPIIAIGGINETNAHDVIKTGAFGIAAIDVFHNSPNIKKTTKNLRNIVEGEYKND